MPELGQQCSIDFFAAHSNFMQDMEVRGGWIVPRSDTTKQKWKMSSGGMSEIDTSCYSHFVVVGLGFNPLAAMHALRRYRLHAFSDDNKQNGPYISAPCFTALMKSTLSNSPAMYFVRLLHALGNSQVVLIPQPYPGEEVLNGKYPHSDFWVKGMASGTVPYVTQLYRDVADIYSQKAGCTLMFQPSSTVARGAFTQAKFSLNSSVGDGKIRDPYHMNKWFGFETLKMLSAEMGWNPR